ncbi:hypothetical protein FAZ15_09895 [Sphingobacterium olei]|uniref:Uncharacterized protein n=1 Tax=Sphingobacterium olei TaxID=2571155 RepID=A0A4U0P2Q0_9SPHI|nr:hypothetical protein [Sphingobacterium olei]TJZ61493.1 hypothetical protein FAZ15_09895 [Sphingobacterium olei]
MKKLLLFLALSFICSYTKAQIESRKTMQFTQAWVWDYENELVPKNEPGHKGEIVIYFEPKKNYWLFTPEAYGTSGEMYNWIIGKPDGTYWLCDTDEFGKKTITKQRVQFALNKVLPKHYKPLVNRKFFNQNKLGFAKIEGIEFKVDYTKTDNSSSVFISDFKADFFPIYFFNCLNIEAKLPFNFPVDFPNSKLLLQEVSTINKAKLQLTFKEISHTEYFIDLKIE